MLPPGAVEGGYDSSGNLAYVCRAIAPLKGSGSYFPANGQCWFDNGGAKVSTQMDLLLVPIGMNAESHESPVYINLPLAFRQYVATAWTS